MFLRGLLSVLFNALALMIVAQLFGGFHLEDFGTALIASLIIAVLNIFIKPILIILTLPITILTLGLFLFFINAITLMMTQGLMGDTFVIDTFGMAFIASIFISIINLLLTKLVSNTSR